MNPTIMSKIVNFSRILQESKLPHEGIKEQEISDGETELVAFLRFPEEIDNIIAIDEKLQRAGLNLIAEKLESWNLRVYVK